MITQTHPPNLRALAGRVASFFGIVVACHLAAPAFVHAQSYHELTLNVRDVAQQPLAARVRVETSEGHYPGYPDDVLMSHRDFPWMGSYFYVEGTVQLQVPTGLVEIEVSRGFEYKPVKLLRSVDRDTTVTVVLNRFFDSRAAGWYGGDVHAHTQHPPSDYFVPPIKARRVVRAEDLAIAWMPDHEFEFTGTPHVLSTPQNIMYYIAEFRNQVYGHVTLLGLTELPPLGCCGPPAPAFPMLSDFREDWNPTPDQAMVLAHPLTGAGFFDEGGWPGAGLGREAPILAANGNLDAYDIASLGNDGLVRIEDWYRLLSCGFRIPPSAGTDTAMGRYWVRPAGCFRVYAYTGLPDLTASDWVQALRAGECFVTNYPLLPEFTVNGVSAGGELAAASGGELAVRFRVQSVLPVERAHVVFNGETVQEFEMPGSSITDLVLSCQLPATESGWLAIRVEGTTDSRTAPSPDLFAHSAPVYVLVDDQPIARTDGAAHFVDWCDSLRIFVENRGNWDSPGDRQHVLDRIDSAQQRYRSLFRLAPSGFGLESPADGDTVEVNALFHWNGSLDIEPGDRIAYLLELRPAGAPETEISVETSDTTAVLPSGALPIGPYEWRVTAHDLGFNTVQCDGGWRQVVFKPVVAAGPALATSPSSVLLESYPNPSPGTLTFRLRGSTSGAVLSIHDPLGRLVRRLAWAGSELTIWDGRNEAGREVPNGVYWVSMRRAEGSPPSIAVHLFR